VETDGAIPSSSYAPGDRGPSSAFEPLRMPLSDVAGDHCPRACAFVGRPAEEACRLTKAGVGGARSDLVRGQRPARVTLHRTG
jgi:hypothetical protein